MKFITSDNEEGNSCDECGKNTRTHIELNNYDEGIHMCRNCLLKLRALIKEKFYSHRKALSLTIPSKKSKAKNG